MSSDRRQTAVDTDLKTGGMRLVEELQHGLVDLDRARFLNSAATSASDLVGTSVAILDSP